MKQVNKKTRRFGSLCKKHPELNGERLMSNGACVGCRKERWLALNKSRANTPVGIAYADRKRNRQVERRAEERAAVFNHYGHECSRCGYTDPRALTIDHTDQNGAKHRKPDGRRYTGAWLYRWLVKNNFPKGFRVLCANCQMIVYKEAS